ncbi:very-long-chain 3-oxoacyl-CoA reductase-like [Ostrea edulis]|uniref:very-long-chain 3-oxoacyl-CoA reductase-like n=1 Tax=Ostrea edulis TaxID=37623 RepID=UPI0024AEE310|nr:very-long-chain 3-oxoacyl-CoA reductase-like [Ostrea edulis]
MNTMASSMINNVFGRGASGYFATFGLIAASYLTLKIALNVIKVLKSFVFAGSTNFKKLGSWAVVTGSTDGIGKAYAKELAKKGVNIVLISRSEAKLQEVSNEIEKESNVQTRIIVADFSKGLEMYDSIRNQLAGLEIGTLVNNVGMSYSFPNYLLDIPDREEFFMRMININVTSVTMMTSIVMPGMVERRRGAVINLSSAAGLSPSPLLTVYSACKAYVTFFSQCIQTEYGPKGINCQCVMPFFVATKMSKIRKPSVYAPSPSTYVKATLNSVGVSSVTHGYWAHRLQGTITSLLPEVLVKTVTLRIFKNARKSYLRKLASKKE